MRTNAAVLMVLLSAGSSGFGQEWAKKMFDHTSHDFGTVARGAKAEHTFVLENIYEEDMVISSVRTTCGCTHPKLNKRRLKTWEKAEIVAELDTRTFYGRKDSTLTVVLGGQFPAEVRLRVYAYIRRDVVVQPGKILFGSVAEGSDSQRKVTVDYAGRSDWRIVKVESANPHLQGQVVETHRLGGRVTYDLHATLKSTTPAGYVRDHLVLITNDPNQRTARVPIAVEGIVAPAVTVQPSPLTGTAATGETASMRLFVQARTSFQILNVHCDDQRFTSAMRKTAGNSYLILITFAAGETDGEVDETIRIETDLAAAKVLEVPVHVRVTSCDPVTP